MSDSPQLGQHLLISFRGTSLDQQFRRTVREHQAGNILLTSDNFGDARDAARLCGEIREVVTAETGNPPLIMLALEDIRETDLRAAQAIPSLMAVAATGDPTLAFTVGRALGGYWHAAGVDMLFTRALEILPEHRRVQHAIRWFSDDPGTTGLYGTEMLRGMRSACVLTGSLRFPGAAWAAFPAEGDVQVVGKTREELHGHELSPFEHAISTGSLDALMLDRACYHAFDTDPTPATCSRAIVTSLAREQLGFDGLVCSADLGLHTGETAQSARLAVRAGVDLVWAGTEADAVSSALSHALETRMWDRKEADRSHERILRTKRLAASWVAKEEKTEGMAGITRAITDRATCIVHLPEDRLPSLGTHPLCIDFACEKPAAFSPADMMADLLGGMSAHASGDPDQREIVRILSETGTRSSLVILTRDAHLRQGQLALANALAGTGLPVVLIALGSPFDLAYLAPNIAALAGFDDSPHAIESLCDVILGRRSATGSLPVHL